MDYKKSKYNFIYKRNDNENVIFNTYSKALIVLDDSEFDQYEAMEFNDESVAEALQKNRIILDKDFDETGFLSYCHYATKFDHKTLHLVIAPTMDCNFQCPYCYENRRSGKMSLEVQDAIVSFVKEKIDSGLKSLDVTWYGGEPLLYPDIVKGLSERIHELTAGTNCELKMFIVTNGYLLTPQIVEMLDAIGIVKAQITLDGLKEHHDLTRHLKGGYGTFDKIYENLKLFDEYDIRVDVRMNVDNKNCGDYAGLKEMLDQLDNPNIVLYPSPVEDINPDTINNISKFMSYEEFESFACDIEGVTGSDTMQTRVLDDRYCFCYAETEGNLVIDELGYCYKCWDQVGRIETACLNITRPEEKNISNTVKFIGWDPFRDEKCKDCVFLPLCFGGCKFHRMNTGKYDCGYTDDSMRRYIENTYFLNK